MSEDAHHAVMAFPEFITESRGIIHIKVQFMRFNNHCRLHIFIPY